VPSYELSQAADSDLTEIYTYTFREFGERQAGSYFASLEACLERLAEQPLLGVDVGWLRAGYRLFVHDQHSIYYKPGPPYLLVVRILGPGMSAELHLR
jgi:toxin ParE1/3/4